MKIRLNESAQVQAKSQPSLGSIPSLSPRERAIVLIDKLIPADYNPRRISERAKEGLRNSIKEFGVVQEIVVNKRNGIVVGGHQRLAVLKEMGVKEVPVVYVDLDEKKEKALNVALNHLSGEFDNDKLEDILGEISEDNIFESLTLDDTETWRISQLNELSQDQESDEWVGMPEFEAADKPLVLNIIFEDEEARQKFVKDYKIKVKTKKGKALVAHFPPKGFEDLKSYKYE